MRPLSRGARGSAVPLIIDVAGNLRRQETKLPAVPPHYDIIREGWPTAGAASRHPSRPAAPAADLLTSRQTNTQLLARRLPHGRARRCAFPGNATGGKGRGGEGRNVLVFGCVLTAGVPLIQRLYPKGMKKAQ